jgi:hypothetical protein
VQNNGNGLQSVYLGEISEEFANRLVGLADAVFPNLPPATEPDPPEEIVAQEERELANLQGRTDTPRPYTPMPAGLRPGSPIGFSPRHQRPPP